MLEQCVLQVGVEGLSFWGSAVPLADVLLFAGGGRVECRARPAWATPWHAAHGARLGALMGCRWALSRRARNKLAHALAGNGAAGSTAGGPGQPDAMLAPLLLLLQQ
eukprot:6933522-Alexandrium_andersonii.AAC.1